jgi:DHA2 family multidrug resistance protein
MDGGGGTGGAGGGPTIGSPHAWANIQNLVLRQANMLAYIDNFWILGVAILCAIPLVFLMKKSKPGGSMAVH